MPLCSPSRACSADCGKKSPDFADRIPGPAHFLIEAKILELREVTVMKEVSLDHPSVEQLAAFGLGRLNELESATIEEHLSGCDTCCQVVDDVAPDSLVHH